MARRMRPVDADFHIALRAVTAVAGFVETAFRFR